MNPAFLWRGDENPPPRGVALTPARLGYRSVSDRLRDTVSNLALRLVGSFGIGGGPISPTVEIGPDTKVGIALLDSLRTRSRAVALVQGEKSGTGFLVAENLILTCSHVLSGSETVVADERDARNARVVFNYEEDLSGALLPSQRFSLDPSRFFRASLELDYAIVWVSDSPSATYGQIPRPSVAPVLALRDNVLIIQHPDGGPKQIAMTGNEVAYVDDMLVQYTADTLPGSSGAPVLDYRLELVGVHHRGGTIVEPRTGRSYFRNEGVLFSAIGKDARIP
jgi:hypothetical protein